MIVINSTDEQIHLWKDQAAVAVIDRYEKRGTSRDEVLIFTEQLKSFEDDDIPPGLRIINSSGEDFTIKPGEVMAIKTKYVQRQTGSSNLYGVFISEQLESVSDHPN